MKIKEAGLWRQVHQLKKRLSDLNTAEANPVDISQVADALLALETRLEKQNARKRERQIAKETKEKELAQQVESENTVEDVSKEADEGASFTERLIARLVANGYGQATAQMEVETYMTGTNTTPDALSDIEQAIKEIGGMPEDVKPTSGPAQTTPVETEKEADTQVFAFDAVVEPIHGASGSYGRVIQHDAANDIVYVKWEDGKLKESHDMGGYSSKDLRLRASKKVAEDYKGFEITETSEGKYKGQTKTEGESIVDSSVENLKNRIDIWVKKDARKSEASFKKKSQLLAVYDVNKMVTKFNEEAQDWSGETQDMGKVDSGNIDVENMEDVIKVVEENTGIQGFEAFSDEPGRYDVNVVENGEGMPDENGKYLADYSLYIKMYREASQKKASMVIDPDTELNKGNKVTFVRSVMSKGGFIIAAGTDGEITDVVGDHVYIKTPHSTFVINKFDAKKLYRTASKKKKAYDEAEDNIGSPEQLGESFVNGNIGYVRKEIGNSMHLFNDVLHWLEEFSPDSVESFRRLMTQASKKSKVKKKAEDAEDTYDYTSIYREYQKHISDAIASLNTILNLPHGEGEVGIQNAEKVISILKDLENLSTDKEASDKKAEEVSLADIYKEQLAELHDERKAMEAALSLLSGGEFDAYEGQTREDAITRSLEKVKSSTVSSLKLSKNDKGNLK